MKTRYKMLNEFDLWKAYNLGLLNEGNLGLEEKRDIASFDESIKERITDDDINYFLNIYGNELENNEFLIKGLAKKYKVDTLTIKIRITQAIKKQELETKKARIRN